MGTSLKWWSVNNEMGYLVFENGCIWYLRIGAPKHPSIFMESSMQGVTPKFCFFWPSHLHASVWSPTHVWHASSGNTNNRKKTFAKAFPSLPHLASTGCTPLFLLAYFKNQSFPTKPSLLALPCVGPVWHEIELVSSGTIMVSVGASHLFMPTSFGFGERAKW